MTTEQLSDIINIVGTIVTIVSMFVTIVQTKKATRQDVINLCDIVNDLSEGRTSHDEIVMCSIGGMPLEDLSWGYDCYQKALEMGIGQSLKLWDEPYMC